MLIKEIFSSIQGEGIHTGAPAIFIRLCGCNLRCSFCDTDHSAGKEMPLRQIRQELRLIRAFTSSAPGSRLVVVTGGEPLIHERLGDLLEVIRGDGFMVELETNGTIRPDSKVLQYCNFISMSPKVPREQIQLQGCTSLKILFPFLPAIDAESFRGYPCQAAYIQPIEVNGIIPTKEAIGEVKRLGWPFQLGLQLHKHLGVA